jgi:hypothetical protein
MCPSLRFPGARKAPSEESRNEDVVLDMATPPGGRSSSTTQEALGDAQPRRAELRGPIVPVEGRDEVVGLQEPILAVVSRR